MQRLRQTLHRGDQTEIQYSAQRTSKSGRTKTSQEIRTCIVFKSGRALSWALPTVLCTGTFRETSASPKRRHYVTVLRKQRLESIRKTANFLLCSFFINNYSTLYRLVTSFYILLP